MRRFEASQRPARMQKNVEIGELHLPNALPPKKETLITLNKMLGGRHILSEHLR
jgi:hypothetical protein